MGKTRNDARRRRPAGPPVREVELDALPPVFRVTCDPEQSVESALNASARRLDLGDPVRRAICRLGTTAVASRHWQSECVVADGVTWLAIVAPCVELGAQVVLLPVSVDADPSRLEDVAPGLTPREREVLTLSLRGGSPRDISAQLGISWHTVRTHLKHAYRALGVSGRAEAVSVVVESARPRIHLRLITDDVDAGSGRHTRPASKSPAVAPASSARHPKPSSRPHKSPAVAPASSARHPKPSSRPHKSPVAPPAPLSARHPKPPSRPHKSPVTRPHRAPTRPPSRPR